MIKDQPRFTHFYKPDENPKGSQFYKSRVYCFCNTYSDCISLLYEVALTSLQQNENVVEQTSAS